MDQPQFAAPPTGNASTASNGKSSQLLIRDYPHRAIAIATSTHALILRHSSTTSEAINDGLLATVPSARPRTDNVTAKCMVEFVPVTRQLLADFRPLTPRPVYGTLGLISIDQDVFLCVVTHATRVAQLRPGESVERIVSVDFFCLNSAAYDNVYNLNPYDAEAAESASAYGQNLARREGEIEYPFQELQKLLSNGSFYYSTDFDMTNRLQDRPVDSNTFNIDNFDDAFLWNSFMINPLLRFRSRLRTHEREVLDASRILTSAIRGFCLTMTIPQSAAPLRAANTGRPSFLTVISRLSCQRAGTRFNSRGIDDAGHVANFVETETIYWSPTGVLFSYAQVRGSVPVFWEQAAGLIPGQQKITVTRSADGTQPAFDRHFEELEQSYGAVHVVNLLSATKPEEAQLTQLYHYGIRHNPLSRTGASQDGDHALLRHTDYDFHAETKAAGYEAAKGIRKYIENSADGFAYYLAEETDDMYETGGELGDRRRLVVVLQQEGIFRTNCLDCLDRTNLIQSLVSQLAVEAFLNHRGEYAASDFWMRHSTLWADNGDALSRIYAGTGALKTSFTRHGKMSLAGAFADARKSATRLYINNFTDKAKQNTIDLLLGRLVGQAPVLLFDPISDFISSELLKRSGEYSSTEQVSIWVGTFNLNGKTTGIQDDLSPWLFPPELGLNQPEIVVVGFQEIVELSAQQIMNSDPTRKQQWEKAIKAALNRRADEMAGERYVLLRSGQLVGAALCIFVKSSALPKIKNVEGSVKKTGMSGIAGNKGAVGIRMDYANTQICFVTAHLAAGFANYDERNRDYDTIDRGLRFQRNRGIIDHDTIVWLGDFNYRVGLTYERAMELVQKRDIEKLYENDQLNLQMVAGLSFPHYSEARITFMPTYKFDIGTDRYDTSEKARIPAWTDRILRKGTNIRQLSYNCADLKFSDHRPVYATFQCTVSIVDEVKRDKLSHQLYERRRADIGQSVATLLSEDSDEDEDLIGYDPIEPGLPPASSDQQRWWLDNGKMAQSSVAAPRGPQDNSIMTLNPKRPANPFTPTEEPDWVAVPRADSRLSSFSSLSSSPYEHVLQSTQLAGGTSNVIPRKLPPPYEPGKLSAQLGRMQLAEETNMPKPKVEVAPPPPPRRGTGGPTNASSSTTSSSTSYGNPGLVPSNGTGNSTSAQDGSRSKPPPVARKPAHLSTTSPSTSPGPGDTSFSGSMGKISPLRPSSAKISDLSSKLQSNSPGQLTGGMQRTTTFPLKSANAGMGHQASATSPPGGVSLPGLGRIDRKAVPPRRAGTMVATGPQTGIQQKPVDLLDGDQAGDMNGWDTLKPT
ncbi:synaptojanin [Microdochium nivale]|nr:synaptojanin [Microdochium nivale]